jgi:hypothetical protein
LTDRVVLDRAGKSWRWSFTEEDKSYTGLGDDLEGAAAGAQQMMRMLWWRKPKNRPKPDNGASID